MMEPKVDEADSNVTGDIILNDDCLIHVFKYLSIRDRIRLQRVNKRWQAVSQASWSSFTTLDFSDELWGGDAYQMINDNSIAKVLAQCGKYLTKCEMHNKHDHLGLHAPGINFDVFKMHDCLGSHAPGINFDVFKMHDCLGPHAPDIDFDVFKLCPNLKSIDFLAAELTDDKMEFFIEHCKNIDEIRFGYNGLQRLQSDHIIGTFAFEAYKNLRVVRFTFCSITGICLRNLSTSNLEELDFYLCYQLDESKINYVVSECPKLKKLLIRRCPTFNYPAIRLPKYLQVLDISSTISCINDDFMNYLTNTCKSLLELNIACTNSNVTDIGMAYVASLPKLQYLCVDQIPLITGRNLPKMTHLRVLSCINCTSIAEEYLEALLEVSDQLESLDLSGCKLVTRNFVISAVNILSSRKNDIILKIRMLHIDQYAVELPNNLKIKFKN